MDAAEWFGWPTTAIRELQRVDGLLRAFQDNPDHPIDADLRVHLERAQSDIYRMLEALRRNDG